MVDNGELLPNTTVVATMDTGTSLVIAPENIAKDFWAKFPGTSTHPSKKTPYTLYLHPCHTKFTAALRIDGKDYNIPPNDVALRSYKNSSKCLGFLGGRPFKP